MHMSQLKEYIMQVKNHIIVAKAQISALNLYLMENDDVMMAERHLQKENNPQCLQGIILTAKT